MVPDAEASFTSLLAYRPGSTSAPTTSSDFIPHDMTIVIAGDTSLGDAYLGKQADARQLDRLQANPLSFFEALTPLIADKSRLLLNLETVLTTSVPASPLDGIKNYLGWDNAERTAGVLRAIGTDAVSLANNHSMDYGATGLLETLAQMRLANIAAIGAGEDARRAAQPLTWTCGEFKIHVLAGFEARRKYREVYGFYAAEEGPGVSSLSASDGQPSMTSRIRNLRSDDPRALIVVFPHWGGSANYQWATAEMSELNSSFISAGADLVIGHGSHMMQQVAIGRSGTTAFSLGNFVFNSPGRYKKHGAPPYSLVCRLRVKQAGDSLSGSLQLYPILSDNCETGYRPRPVNEAEATTVYDLLARNGDQGFAQAFSLNQDERGWYLALSAPASPRLSSSS